MAAQAAPRNGAARREKHYADSGLEDVWANSDAFEQGAFAAHLQTDPAWVEHITMANPRTHNAPCSSFDEAQRRSALTCHFLAEYAMPLQPVIADRVVSLTVSPL